MGIKSENKDSLLKDRKGKICRGGSINAEVIDD